MIQNIIKWFQKDDHNAGAVAKRRLQLVLVNNRVGLTPDLMDQLKNDIMDVVSKYFEVDQDTTDFNVERSEESIALVSNIGVKRVLRKWDKDAEPTQTE